MTPGQRLALEQLEAIAAEGDAFELIATDDSDNSESIFVTVSLRCSDIESSDAGLRLRQRERFTIEVRPDFPFSVPSVEVSHRGWAGTPHVQWANHLCLYQAPATEWNPSDGMYGLLDRLRLWLERAAIGELDEAGAPLHPPANYAIDWSLPIVVPRADTPDVGPAGWLGLAELEFATPRRIDLTGWHELRATGLPEHTAAAILLPQPLAWEYPTTVNDLLREFERQGMSRELVVALLGLAALRVPGEQPLYVVVGSPMRRLAGGDLRQHIEVWRLDPIITGALRLAMEQFDEREEIREIGRKAEAIVLGWASRARIEFARVREDRPEVTARRDERSALEVFRGKSVTIWGCGALGGWIAECLTRAGVGKLTLRDSAVVAPGVLVRQPFDDADVGYPKATRLGDRLVRINPKLEICPLVENVLTGVLDQGDWSDGADILIDATASATVAAKLERARRQRPQDCTVISALVGHNAERGIVVIAHPDATGAPADILRRAKLECARRTELAPYLDEFWPEDSRREVFQPEPGCSDATFRGSAAEVVALATTLLTAAATELLAPQEPSGAHVCALPGNHTNGCVQKRLAWPADIVVEDGFGEYQVRISRSAFEEMRGWFRTARRTRGRLVETGGLLFGQRDDASGVLWVSEVTGPPPDSTQSAQEFVCGTSGNDRYRDEKRARGRGSVEFVGMWHTHPEGRALCSERDVRSMVDLVLQDETPLPKSLALIVGGTPDDPEVGGYVFTRREFSQPKTWVLVRDNTITPGPSPVCEKNIGLALSGGGSRAIAFHLGCLRALHDRDLLDRIHVISGVSGGSVMTGAYAYSDDDFGSFDQRIVELLQRGLAGGIVRRGLLSKSGLRSAATMVSSGVAAVGARAASTCAGAAGLVPGIPRNRLPRPLPPLRRFGSVTDGLSDTLAAELFGEKRLGDRRRDNIGVVINATELRTGTAFRFGSRESGSWRFGQIEGNDIRVAEAVAASAAYPMLLPALDKKWRFTTRKGETLDERVVLTDGGVYDNLGTSCLEPGRSSDFSFNTYDVDYIVSCDAGRGQPAADSVPYFWISRMRRSFEAIFRKAQDGGRARLHQFAADGHLDGFVMAYLGNRDERLPVVPADLVPRERVVDYPTDFSAMSMEDIEAIAARGERLTRLLIDHHCPEL